MLKFPRRSPSKPDGIQNRQHQLNQRVQLYQVLSSVVATRLPSHQNSNYYYMRNFAKCAHLSQLISAARMCVRVALCVLCACVWSRGCASTCAVISRILGPLASLAAAVSVLFCVRIFWVACCRALLDIPELGESLMRMCGRAAALQPAARNHTNCMGALASLAVTVSAMCYVGGVCAACCRALVDKPEPGASFVQFVRSRGCFPNYRAQSHQGLVWRVQLWRGRFQLRFASTLLAAVLALRGCTSARLRACVSCRLAQPEHHSNE